MMLIDNIYLEIKFWIYLFQESKPEGEGNEYIKLKVVGQVSMIFNYPELSFYMINYNIVSVIL